MFERIVDARSEKRGRARAVFFGVSTAAHAVGLGALLVWSFWTIERLEARTVPVTFVATAAPPPPPPPAAPPPVAEVASGKVVRRVVKEIVQPVPEAPETPPETSAGGEPSTDPGSDPAGVPGGLPGAEPCVDCAPPPVIIDDRPVVITADEAARIAGEREIPLPPAVKQAMAAQGRREVVALAKLCLDRAGVPSDVRIGRSTGYAEADARIAAEMWRWRYRPYRVNGNPVPVCTAITFRYQLE